MRPIDLPDPEVFAARYPHGIRVRYVCGCRCDQCRRANTEYEKRRTRLRARGDWNGLVPADRARRHLRRLSRMGIGKNSVRAACDVARSSLDGIRRGIKRRIRARTERRILAVDAAARADRALVSAGHCWHLIRRLLNEGFTKAGLARRLGYRTPALQLRRNRVTARNDLRIRILFRNLTE